jgi:hypothetical protein
MSSSRVSGLYTGSFGLNSGFTKTLFKLNSTCITDKICVFKDGICKDGLRGTLYYGRQVHRILDRLLLKDKAESIKIYKLWNLYNFGKKSFFCSRRVWISINITDKLSPTKQILGTKTHKKCCHVGILESVGLWLMASSIKTEQTNSCSPPITLLESFVHSINGIKCPSTLA